MGLGGGCCIVKKKINLFSLSTHAAACVDSAVSPELTRVYGCQILSGIFLIIYFVIYSGIFYSTFDLSL
jgi:hypothetical protein